MGVVAFFVLMVAELALAVLVFRRSATEQLGAYSTAREVIGLAAQAIFALLPVIQVWSRQGNSITNRTVSPSAI